MEQPRMLHHRSNSFSSSQFSTTTHTFVLNPLEPFLTFSFSPFSSYFNERSFEKKKYFSCIEAKKLRTKF